MFVNTKVCVKLLRDTTNFYFYFGETYRTQNNKGSLQ